MVVWIYAGPAGLFALAAEADGSGLPLEQGPWKLVRGHYFGGKDPDEAQAIALIEQHGFCCFK